MANLQLRTVGENVTWPASGTGQGMCVACLCKRPSSSTQSEFFQIGIARNGETLSAPLLAFRLWGRTNANNQFLGWNGATSTVTTTDDTPFDNKRFLMMVGYNEDAGGLIDLVGRWKDTDAAGTTYTFDNRTKPSWPPSTGEPYVFTNVVGSFVDEFLVFNEHYTSTLFDAVYAELLT